MEYNGKKSWKFSIATALLIKMWMDMASHKHIVIKKL